jgi:hypothetical protein
LSISIPFLTESKEVKIGFTSLIYFDDNLFDSVFQIDESLGKYHEIINLYMTYNALGLRNKVDDRKGFVAVACEDTEVGAWIKVIKMQISIQEGNLNINNTFADEVKFFDIITSVHNAGTSIILLGFHQETELKNKICTQSNKVRHVHDHQLSESKI